jgi:nucleoside phosphorylase
MEISGNAVAVGAAMQWEVAAVLAALRTVGDVRPLDRGRWSADLERAAVVVYRTGVGMKAARRRTRDLLRDTKPWLVVNTGCAGVLEDGWAAGDVAVATEILGPLPAGHRARIDPAVREMICEIAEASLPGRIRAARVLTTRLPLQTESAKRTRAIDSDVQVVEMEGAGVFQAIEQSPCTFLSARVVLDPVEADLPDLRLWAGSRRARAIALARSMLSPAEAYRIAATLRNGWLARKSLVHFWRAVFEALNAGTIDRDLSGLRY